MKLYPIIRNGIYMQGLFEICTDRIEAIKKAKHYASLEPDDYHQYKVFEVETDSSIGVLDDMWCEMPLPIFTVDKRYI